MLKIGRFTLKSYLGLNVKPPWDSKQNINIKGLMTQRFLSCVQLQYDSSSSESFCIAYFGSGGGRDLKQGCWGRSSRKCDDLWAGPRPEEGLCSPWAWEEHSTCLPELEAAQGHRLEIEMWWWGSRLCVWLTPVKTSVSTWDFGRPVQETTHLVAAPKKLHIVVSSFACCICHLPIWSRLPLSSVSPCPPGTGLVFCDVPVSDYIQEAAGQVCDPTRDSNVFCRGPNSKYFWLCSPRGKMEDIM